MSIISVIVPVYKVEHYLDRCVESVLAQTFTDFELILVDDGSPDNSPEMCDEWAKKDNRIKVIHKQNGGLSSARNAGIDYIFTVSNSEWLTFIDSDDWVHSEYLQRLYDAAVEYDVSVSVCGYKNTEGENPDIAFDDLVSKLLNTEAFFCAHTVNATLAWGKLYRKECFESIRYPVGKLHEDEFVTYRILFKFPEVVVIPAPLYAYYTNPNGIMGSKSSLNRTDCFDAIEEQIVYFEANGFLKARIAAERSYIQSILYRINSLKNSPDADNNVLKEMCRKKRVNAKRYARHLNPDDPKDEFVLIKLYPIRMKLYIYFRAILRKLRLSK